MKAVIRLDCADAHTDLGLCYPTMYENTFSHGADHMIVVLLCDFLYFLMVRKYIRIYYLTLSGVCVHYCAHNVQGLVVQSVVSLTSSLRVISLTVLADSIYNILIFLLKKI